LPLVLNDPRLHAAIPVVLAGVLPFCSALGYLTPKIIDEYSSGQPRGAGRAYALNILGCILGPLFASYILLPRLGVKGSITDDRPYNEYYLLRRLRDRSRGGVPVCLLARQASRGCRIDTHRPNPYTSKHSPPCWIPHAQELPNGFSLVARKNGKIPHPPGTG
ncbi:MAG: hypothetical protein JW821_11430, partial [Deltaproteobacteria bacterium]|nr:hypothetical protein [Deltaproteobacteria bacterium]